MSEVDKMEFPKLVSYFRFEYNELLSMKLAERGIDDLQSSYASIIYYLLKHKELTMKDLANKIKRDASTLTVLIRKLEKNGYITKRENPEDTRSKLIALTGKGQSVEPIFVEVSEEMNRIIWNNVNEEEAKAMIRCLNKVTENMIKAKE